MKIKTKIITIVGARPQFVKLAPLSRRLHPDFDEVIVHTGQHYDEDLSAVFFDELGIKKPDYNLEIGSGNHGSQTGQMLIKIEEVLIIEKPDLVITFGDTNSTLAGALAASKLGIKSIHIESGLRSFNREMPEEINRIVADHTSDHLFVSNAEAKNNLVNEGLESKVTITGDIMVDTVLDNVERANSMSQILDTLQVDPWQYNLLTLHRPYNVDNPSKLAFILNELGKLPEKIIFPIHPRTNKMVESNNISLPENMMTTKPLGYLDFIRLQGNAKRIITDSGGIQKEAYVLKRPCITLRSETEWTETVSSGWNLLINPIPGEPFHQKISDFTPPKTQKDLYGTNVSDVMIAEINNILNH